MSELGPSGAGLAAFVVVVCGWSAGAILSDGLPMWTATPSIAAVAGFLALHARHLRAAQRTVALLLAVHAALLFALGGIGAVSVTLATAAALALCIFACGWTSMAIVVGQLTAVTVLAGTGDSGLGSITDVGVAYSSLLLLLGTAAYRVVGLQVERERLGAELNAVNSKYQNLVALAENTRDGLMFLDLNEQVRALNGTTREFFAMQGADVNAGDGLMTRLSGPECRTWREYLQGVYMGEAVERVVVRKSPESCAHEILMLPVLDDEHELRGVAVVIREVTERLAEQERLQELNADLVEATRKAATVEVTSTVLHDVGNVLNSVNVCAHYLAGQVGLLDNGQLARAIGLLRRSTRTPSSAADFFGGDRGKKLLEFLPKISAANDETIDSVRTETGQLIRNLEHMRSIIARQQEDAMVSRAREAIRIEDLITDALQLAQLRSGHQDISLIADLDEALWIRSDRHAVLRILVNLLANAKQAVLEFDQPPRTITVRAFERDGRCVVSIADTGVGISPEDAQRIFEHGFTTKEDGHGFGLHGSHKNAEELGGTLAWTSKGRGHGATFELELPGAHRDSDAAPPGSGVFASLRQAS